MLDLIKKLQDFNINGQMGLYLSGRIKLDNGELVYSNIIEDSYWNYIFNLNANSKEEFIKVWENCRNIMTKRNRIPTLYILPTSNIYNRISEILPHDFEEAYTDLWMILKDINSLKPYEYNGEIDLNIEITNDKYIFADTLVNGFRSDNPNDPYGVIPDYYKTAIYNSFENNNSDYKKLNYLVKDGNIPIAITTAILKDDFAGIYNVATIREYRRKGICRALMDSVFSDLKSYGIKTIFLQTEKGVYTEKFYNILGFEGIFEGKAFVEKK